MGSLQYADIVFTILLMSGYNLARARYFLGYIPNSVCRVLNIKSRWWDRLLPAEYCISYLHHYADMSYALDSYSWAIAYIGMGFTLLYWRQAASYADKTGLGHYNVYVLYSI